MRHERSTKHDGKHSNGDIQTMAKININELKSIMFAEIDKLPDGPHKRDKIRQFKRECRKLKLQIRYETSQNAHTSV